MKINKMSKTFILLLLLIFTGCSSVKISEGERKERTTKIVSFYKEWKGTRYRLGGTTKKGIDCSALVQRLYKEKFNTQLPRTTKAQAEQGEKIKDINDLQVGDLVFFKIGWRNTRHVGVYLGNEKFLHASTTKGVMISNWNEFWDKNFWQGRKVL